MVKDIYPSNNSRPKDLCLYNGYVYFSAIDPNLGRELWKTDGTEAGTIIVKDINPGSDSSYPFHLTEFNGLLFFRALDGIYGEELWKSDGTEEGTVLVKDICQGYCPSPGISNLIKINGRLYFSASDVEHGEELWISDGTEAGTLMVKDIVSSTGDSAPEQLTEVNGILFFTANDAISGRELWYARASLPGDFEPDGDVDIYDLGMFVEQWLYQGVNWADVWPTLVGDGIVNLPDFAIAAENWLSGTE
jgi:ELWxxDGT repeat protein